MDDLPDDRLAAARPRAVTRTGGAVGVLAVALVAAALVALVALIVTGTIVAGGAWILFGVWFFGCRGSRCRSRYGHRPPPGGWNQVQGPADPPGLALARARPTQLEYRQKRLLGHLDAADLLHSLLASLLLL